MVAFSVPLNSQCPVISEKQERIGIKTNVKTSDFFILKKDRTRETDTVHQVKSNTFFS